MSICLACVGALNEEGKSYHVVCGAYRTQCTNGTLEEHLYIANYNEYPTNFTKKWNYYLTDDCDTTELDYEVYATADVYLLFLLFSHV